MTLFILFVCIIALLFLFINIIFAPHNPYQEKYSIFECGFHSFLGQNRTQFGIKFFIYALVYLILDLEILLVYPFAVSEYKNNIYGLIITLIFIIIVTIGFIFELGKGALKIDSRQNFNILNKTNIFNVAYNNKFTPKKLNKTDNFPLNINRKIISSVSYVYKYNNN
jgi:NADH-ubiquinone oxidoreductase chain 3